MSIKNKINRRIALIKDYAASVAYCRGVQKQYDQARQAITAVVDEEKATDTYACIKNYFTSLQSLNISEVQNEMYPETITCHRFDEKPCRVFNCPFYKKNLQFRNMEMLLAQAQNSKSAAWRTMFQRIK